MLVLFLQVILFLVASLASYTKYDTRSGGFEGCSFMSSGEYVVAGTTQYQKNQNELPAISDYYLFRVEDSDLYPIYTSKGINSLVATSVDSDHFAALEYDDNIWLLVMSKISDQTVTVLWEYKYKGTPKKVFFAGDYVCVLFQSVSYDVSYFDVFKKDYDHPIASYLTPYYRDYVMSIDNIKISKDNNYVVFTETVYSKFSNGDVKVSFKMYDIGEDKLVWSSNLFSGESAGIGISEDNKNLVTIQYIKDNSSYPYIYWKWNGTAFIQDFLADMQHFVEVFMVENGVLMVYSETDKRSIWVDKYTDYDFSRHDWSDVIVTSFDDKDDLRKSFNVIQDKYFFVADRANVDGTMVSGFVVYQVSDGTLIHEHKVDLDGKACCFDMVLDKNQFIVGTEYQDDVIDYKLDGVLYYRTD